MNRLVSRCPGVRDGWARFDGPVGTQLVDTAITAADHVLAPFDRSTGLLDPQAVIEHSYAMNAVDHLGLAESDGVNAVARIAGE